MTRCSCVRVQSRNALLHKAVKSSFTNPMEGLGLDSDSDDDEDDKVDS